MRYCNFKYLNSNCCGYSSRIHTTLGSTQSCFLASSMSPHCLDSSTPRWRARESIDIDHIFNIATVFARPLLICISVLVWLWTILFSNILSYCQHGVFSKHTMDLLFCTSSRRNNIFGSLKALKPADIMCLFV